MHEIIKLTIGGPDLMIGTALKGHDFSKILKPIV